MTATGTPRSTLLERLERVPIYLIVTCEPDDAAPALARAAAAARVLQQRAGAVAVQLRCKRATTDGRRDVLARARAALPTDALLLVNDDLAAVLAPDGKPLADGVHLGREDAAALAPPGTPAAARIAAGLRAARARLGPARLLGTSTRTRAELASALAAGADHAGFGAIASSPTKADTHPAELAELQRLIAEFPHVPVFPIGGLSPRNLPLVVAAGARRAALGSAVLDAADPAAAALECLRLVIGAA